jgi:hypothetical protein
MNNINTEDKIIINKEIIYHIDEDDNYENGYENFGILKIKTDKIKKIHEREEKLIIFTIDRSGSMLEKCSDNNTKIEHIIFTLENIIKYFVNLNKNKENLLSISIIIMTFDIETRIIVEKTKITEENSIKIIKKIRGIKAENSTNFEKPLELVKKIVKENICGVHMDTENVRVSIDTEKNDQLYNSSEITHIFMTDGEVTDGKKCLNELTPLINTEIQNIFIGFGISHDSDLLNQLSNLKNGKYYFIDLLENSGLVYGEIAHEIVNKVLENIEIKIENGFIYNWKLNKWENKLLLDNLVKDKENLFQIKRENKDIEIKINYKIPNQDRSDKCIVIECLDIKEEDLTKYIYRQKTQELLFKANKINSIINDKNRNDNVDDDDIELYNVKLITEKRQIKKDIKKLFDSMKEFMIKNGLENDSMMKLLCDDMFVTYKTFENSNSHFYSRARQVSQGTQQIYTVTDVPVLPPSPSPMSTMRQRFNQNLFVNHSSASILIPQPIRRGENMNMNLNINIERDRIPPLNIDTYIEVDNDDPRYNDYIANNDDMETMIPKYDSFEDLDLYSYNYFEIINDDTIDLNYRHELSQYNESPFISPSSLDFMSSISTRTRTRENSSTQQNYDDIDVNIDNIDYDYDDLHEI